MEISSELLTEISPYIGQNEKILWCDKPVKNFIIAGAEIFNVLFGAFWLAFSIFWLIMTLVDKNSGALPYFSIPFILLGLWLVLFKHLVQAVKRKKIIYVVTNKRVLVVTTGKEEFVEEFCYSDIAEIDMKADKNGIGSVFFYSSPKDPKKKVLTSSGIFGIKDTSVVFEIINERLEKK